MDPKHTDLGSYKAEIGMEYTGLPPESRAVDDICRELGRVADAAWSIVFLLAILAGLVAYAVCWR